MNFGLTGIGIGGLFYIACAIVILVREGYKKMRSRYHKHPRQLLLDLSIILIGIVAATILTDTGIQALTDWIVPHLSSVIDPNTFVPSTGLTPGIGLVVSAGVLLVVVTTTSLLRFVFKKRSNK